MAKVQFNTTVKYKNNLYTAFTPFEVDDNDFDYLVKMGCHVLEHPIQKVVKADETATKEKTDIEQESTKDDNSPTTTRARRTRR